MANWYEFARLCYTILLDLYVLDDEVLDYKIYWYQILKYHVFILQNNQCFGSPCCSIHIWQPCSRSVRLHGMATLYILPVHIPSTIYKYGKKNARNIDYTFTCSQKDFQSCKDSSIIKINLGNNVTYNNCCFCAKFVGDHLIKTVGNILIWQHCATV